MANVIYLEAYTEEVMCKDSSKIRLPLESFITYCIYKCCCPEAVNLFFVYTKNTERHKTALTLKADTNNFNFIDGKKIPWLASSCLFPVIMCDDTIITGLCAVARHICKYRSTQCSNEHEEGVLGFRKSCLQAPNEVSIWTKFCEIDIIKTVKELLAADTIPILPQNLVRFENHLSKPVRVHNVYKIARNIKKENVIALKSKSLERELCTDNENITEKIRVPKIRKWKSNCSKQFEINSSTKIEDLDINHKFAEGPFLTLADLVLIPSYHIIIQSIGETIFESLMPLTHKWYTSIRNIPELETLFRLMSYLESKSVDLVNRELPTTDNVSLYKCDPKRHNPKKRLFTKEDDIENALCLLTQGMELNITSNGLEKGIDWSKIPDGANPFAGHLPDERNMRKSQQLENLALAVLNIAKDGDLIVDFCSGSGHLGILIAYLLPKCIVILLENKEQSLLRARKRVQETKLSNVYFFQCNLDFFIGKFDIGVALHACGIASDLVLDKCLKANAKFVLCPCCYGSLHATDRLEYPRSQVFNAVPIDQYLCIGHAADQTHKEHPLTIRGAKCMAVIDSDRCRLAEQFGYNVTLSRLKPLSCTPKNNLLIGVPS